MTRVAVKIAAAALAGGMVVVLALPVLVDWSSLRPGIERTATATLGWPVTVSGPVAVRLLPTPGLVLERVGIGAAGFEKIRLDLGVVPLLSGRIAIAAIAVSGGRLGGGVTLDGRVGIGEIFASSGPLDGGFTASGRVGVGGLDLPFEAGGGRPGGGAASPVHGALRLPESLGGEVRFVGAIAPGHADGRVWLEVPSLARAAGSDSLPDLPLTGEGRLSVSSEEAAIQEITLALGESRAGGEIVAVLGALPVAVDVSLRAATLDLDQGRPAASVSAKSDQGKKDGKSGGGAAKTIASAQGLRLPLPANLTVNVDIVADTVRWLGGVVRRPRLNAMLDGGVLTISHASAQLPGATALGLNGTLTMGEGGPVFDGRVRLDSADPPRLRAWAWPGSGGGSWPTSARFDATLSGHDGRLDLSPLVLSLDDLRLTGAVGLGSAITARLALRGIEATFNGDPAAAPGTLVGALALRGPSFAEAARLFASDYRPSRDGALAVSARLSREGGAVAFDDLRVMAGAALINGRVRIEPDQPIRADLTAGEVRLDPFLPPEAKGPAPRPIVAGAGAGRPAFGRSGRDESPIPPPVPRGRVEAAPLNTLPRADVTLTIATLMVKGWRLDELSAHLALGGNGGAALDGLRARMLGGRIEGSGRIAPGGGFSSSVSVAGIEAGGLGLSAGRLALAAGRLDGRGQITAAGLAPAVLAATLGGTATLSIGDGQIRGFDLAEANARLGRGDVAGLLAGGLVGGVSRFSKLAGSFRAEGGVVSSRDLSLTAEGGSLTGSGSVDLGRKEVDARVSIAPAAAGLPPLGVRLHGRLDAPDMVFDANALQRAVSNGKR
jgi:hypothetical protein